jgi:hypothetical protein
MLNPQGRKDAGSYCPALSERTQVAAQQRQSFSACMPAWGSRSWGARESRPRSGGMPSRTPTPVSPGRNSVGATKPSRQMALVYKAEDGCDRGRRLPSREPALCPPQPQRAPISAGCHTEFGTPAASGSGSGRHSSSIVGYGQSEPPASGAVRQLPWALQGD